MSEYGLMPNQRAVLDFIKATVDALGYSPSYQEILDGCGFKSKSEVHRLVLALEERGHIHRIPKRGRSLALGPARTETIWRCPHCDGAIRLGEESDA